MSDESTRRSRVSKIDQHDLGEQVLACVAQGMTSGAIAARLTADGCGVSQPTVSRWIKANRGDAQSKARVMFSEHVDRELPKDLEALEEMEALCLAWAREDSASRCRRLMAWDRVVASLDQIAEELRVADLEPDVKKSNKVIAGVIQRIVGWVVDDAKDQKRRLDAMAMGTKIIVGKLQHAGVLDSDEDWGVTIKPYDGSVALGEEGPGQQHLFSVKSPGAKS